MIVRSIKINVPTVKTGWDPHAERADVGGPLAVSGRNVTDLFGFWPRRVALFSDGLLRKSLFPPFGMSFVVKSYQLFFEFFGFFDDGLVDEVLLWRIIFFFVDGVLGDWIHHLLTEQVELNYDNVYLLIVFEVDYDNLPLSLLVD